MRMWALKLQCCHFSKGAKHCWWWQSWPHDGNPGGWTRVSLGRVCAAASNLRGVGAAREKNRKQRHQAGPTQNGPPARRTSAHWGMCAEGPGGGWTTGSGWSEAEVWAEQTGLLHVLKAVSWRGLCEHRCSLCECATNGVTSRYLCAQLCPGLLCLERLSFHQEDLPSMCRTTRPRPSAQAVLGASVLWTEGLVWGVFMYVTGPRMSRRLIPSARSTLWTPLPGSQYKISIKKTKSFLGLDFFKIIPTRAFTWRGAPC